MTFERVLEEYLYLKRAGHAVLLDDTFGPDGKLVNRVVHHYLTCRECERAAIQSALPEQKA